MAISAPFGSEKEADNAYYGSGDGGDGDQDGDNGNSATWGELQEGSALGQGWTLAYQDQQNGDRRRWFVIGMDGDTLQALNSSGSAVSADSETTLSELPHYSNEDDARAAYQAWAESNGEDGGGEQDDESNEWGNWSKVSEEAPWHIYSRTHQNEDRAQFLATSTLQDDSAVYLASGGEVVDDPNVFDNADALTKALQAFYERSENGEIPEDRAPTGDDPGREAVRNQASSVKTSSSSEKVKRLVERMGGQKVVLAGLAVGGFAVYQSQTNGGD